MVSDKASELEGVLAKLRDLAGRKPLPDKDLKRAKELMARLRKMAFTNQEISELTGGAWAESTIKPYLRGVTVEDPSPKDNAIKLLTEVVDRGLTLDRVEGALSLSEGLRVKGLIIEDVSGLLEEAKRFKVDVADLFRMYKEMKASGLAVEDIKNALAYKAGLESSGFTFDALPKLSEASKAYGGFAKVMEAMDSYGGLESLRAEAKKVASEKAKLEREVENLKKDVKDLEGRRAAADEALKTYEELRKVGFEFGTLQKLREASSKYSGVEEVLAAVNAYGNLKDLEEALSKLSKEKADVEAEVNRLNAKYAHLQTIVKICDILLYEYGFSVSAIKDMYELGKRHGNPLEVLKAIGLYGEVKTLEGEIESLSSKKGELEARVKELEAKVQELRGVADEIKLSVSGVLKPLSNEVKKGVESIASEFKGAVGAVAAKYQDAVTKYKEHSENLSNEVKRGVESITAEFKGAIDAIAKKYEELTVECGEFSERLGKLKAEAGKLEEELMLARHIQALVRYPTGAKDIPLDYDLLMIKAITNHCRVKNVNPKVQAGELIYKKSRYSINASAELELIDLLGWAEKGLTSALGG